MGLGSLLCGSDQHDRWLVPSRAERSVAVTRIVSLALSVGLVIALLSIACQAQPPSYPSRAIECVSATTAGSAGDLLPREVVDILTKEKIVSQPISVVNKPGGSSAVATAYVAEKKGDPYYLYHITTVHVTTPLSTGSTSWKVLSPVANLVMDANLIAVAADSPYKSIKDLVDASKTGAKITWGGGSVTASENLNRHLINKHLGGNIEFISFSGGGEAIPAVLGGHVQVIMRRVFEVAEMVKAGKLRAIATIGDERLPAWPDIPTLKELGVPSVPGGFRGFALPGGVPPETVKYWEDALAKVRVTPAWKKFADDNDLADGWMKSKEFAQFLEERGKDYESVMREMGLVKK